MATPAVIDLDALLAPLAGDAPTGTDLRKDFSPTAPYRVIRDARNQARRVENKIAREDSASGEKPDWRPVLTESPRVLTTLSKDLELAAYLVEALVREHGFAGLRDGFQLCRGLVDQYWDGLYPVWAAEGDDQDELPQRVAALAGLNGVEGDGTLIVPIRSVSLVDARNGPALGLSRYEQAIALASRDSAERDKLVAQGMVTLEAFEQGVAGSSLDFYRGLADDLRGAMDEFEKLTASLETRCGIQQSPPASNIRDALRACWQRVESLLNQKGGGPLTTSSVAATSELSTTGGGAGQAVMRSGPIQTRDQAFAMLLQVASFFRETEPHSVLPFQLEQAVKWGRMSLPELLSELIYDRDTREQFFKRVGIPLAQDS